MRKFIIIFFIFTVLVLVFIEKCSLINLSTSDVFRPNSYKTFKGLSNKVSSKKYEILKIEGDFPILFDSIKNEFYLSNKNGLTKIDAMGNVMFSENLLKEKYTSVFDFVNHTPYVFSEKGVYDFSGNELVFLPYSKIQNAENDISNSDFKTLFENYYQNADLVIFGNERNNNLDYSDPIYFRINNQWILLFSQEGYFRFNNNTIGNKDLEMYPAKLNNNKLIVLKDNEYTTYSTKQLSDKIDDEYLNTYHDKLKEQKLDYQSNNKIKMLSYKKEAYHFTGSYLSLPDWVFPTYLNAAYFQLTYNGDNLYFKEKTIKFYSEPEPQNNLNLYQLPKKFRNKSEVSFIDFNLNLGGYMDRYGSFVPENKNIGIYIVKPKK